MPYPVSPGLRRPSLLGLLAITLIAASSAKEKPHGPNEAPPEVVAWVKSHALPLATVEAGNGFADLEPLRAKIGDARIVALGETTHGSREVFQMKHRLVEFLASELGFTLFALEANMPEAQRLDAYVRGGEGNVDALIRGMYFWTWSTVEVRELVEWMRRFNADPANRARGRQIGFTGFDMQTPDVAARLTREFVAAHAPTVLPKMDQALAAIPASPSSSRFGWANGSFPIEPARGRRIVFSGWIKTAAITNGWAGLWWRADTADRVSAAFDNMQSNGPRGTTPWTRYELTLDIPADATNIDFGMIMPGKGEAWFDDLQVSIDGEPFDPGTRFDFGFESETLVGFPSVSTSGYNTALVPAAHSGKQALRISSTAADHSAVPPTQALSLWRDCETAIRALPDSGAPGFAAAKEWAAQNARIVIQNLEHKLGLISRDRAMADNVLWLAGRQPGAKIILWAHNGHVARGGKMLGGALSEKLGTQLRIIGFATGEGTYRAAARNGNGITVLPLAGPAPGSVEAVCAATGLPRFAIDLRPAARDARSPAAWFDAKHPHRLIGSGERLGPAQFQPRSVGREYDLLIWLSNTQASVPLPN